jgi:surface antigen
MSAGGCAQVGLTQGTDSLYTGSIKASVTDGVDPSDWETMRQVVAGIAPADADLTRPWTNPQTGSYGSITVGAAEQRSGGACRSFSTTVSDLRGVRRYRGEACQPVGGRWQLSDIRADDSKLL